MPALSGYLGYAGGNQGRGEADWINGSAEYAGELAASAKSRAPRLCGHYLGVFSTRLLFLARLLFVVFIKSMVLESGLRDDSVYDEWFLSSCRPRKAGIPLGA